MTNPQLSLYMLLTVTIGMHWGTGAETRTPPTDQTRAAVKFNWGAPLAISDEFNYTGAPDPAKWTTPSGWDPDGCGAGHSGNGRRCHKNSVVDGINGNPWFSFSEADITAMPSGHLNIQLDNFGSTRPARFEVDWIRTYN